MDDLDRMFRRLVQNIRTGYPDYLERPFEVAELYQNVIPYRHNRGELGLEQNQDYEMALLRLLSGERGYLVVDDAMRVELQQELASPNPDTGAFRAHSAAQIGLSPEAVRRLDQYLAGGGRPNDDARLSRSAMRSPALGVPMPPLPKEPVSAPIPAARAAGPPPAPVNPPMNPPAAAPPPPARVPFTARPPAPRPPEKPMSAPPPNAHPAAASAPRPATSATASDADSCRYCAGHLPAGRRIVFCPHCGQNLTVQHCPACSTELEIGWKFCTTCGRSVA